MEKQHKKVDNAQGAEETKERMPSPALAIKTMGTVTKRMETLKLLNKEDVETLKKLHKKAIEQYMGYEMNI